MEKQRKEKPGKKVGDMPRKSAGNQSEYKTQQAAGKSKNSDGQMQKAFGKSKDSPRKG